MTDGKLTHFDEEGRSRMVDVTGKAVTKRTAVAAGSVRMKPETLSVIIAGTAEKGNVLEVARVAAVLAVKQTPNLIPMCHPLMISSVDVSFTPVTEDNRIDIDVTVSLDGKTGVEMEALTGVSVAALTIYDMVKAVDKEMTIDNIRLVKKTGGKSGTFERS